MKHLFFKHRRTRAQKRLDEIELGKAISILDDEVFKAVLTDKTEDSREALRSLVSACTHREVSDLRIMNSELLSPYRGGKKPRVDVYVTFNDGESAILEMQTNRSDDDLKKRAEYYLSAFCSRVAANCPAVTITRRRKSATG